MSIGAEFISVLIDMAAPADSSREGLEAARRTALALALSVADDADALARAQQHLDNLTKLEKDAGLTRRRDLVHGGAILALVLLMVGLGLFVRVGRIATVVAIEAKEVSATSAALLLSEVGQYADARLMVNARQGVDETVKKLLSTRHKRLSLTQVKQTSDTLRTSFRQQPGCQTWRVNEGSVVLGFSSESNEGSATAFELVLQGSRAQPSSLEICGQIERAPSLLMSLDELSVAQRMDYGVLETAMISSLVSGEIDIGGRRLPLTTLDMVYLNMEKRREAAKMHTARLDLQPATVAVRFSGMVKELKVGAGYEKRNCMPSMLEFLSRESLPGVVYSTVLAAFALLWGLRKVLGFP